MVLRLIKIAACYGIGESLGIPTQILRQFIYKLCVGALALYDFTDHRELIYRGQTLLTGDGASSTIEQCSSRMQ